MRFFLLKFLRILVKTGGEMAKLKTGRHTSALKEAKKSKKRRAANRAMKEKVKKQINLLKKAVSEGLLPILCVGETLQEREDEKTETVLREQLDSAFNDLDATEAEKVIVAYEPVWAIGTGKTATPKIAGDAHIFIRNRVKELYNAVAAEDLRILYGGSVKPANARELLSVPDIDGALIGGASLQPDSFAEIIKISLEG